MPELLKGLRERPVMRERIKEGSVEKMLEERPLLKKALSKQTQIGPMNLELFIIAFTTGYGVLKLIEGYRGW